MRTKNEQKEDGNKTQEHPKPKYANALKKTSNTNIRRNLSNHDKTNHTKNSALLSKLESTCRGPNKHDNKNTKINISWTKQKL